MTSVVGLIYISISCKRMRSKSSLRQSFGRGLGGSVSRSGGEKVWVKGANDVVGFSSRIEDIQGMG